MLQNDPKPEPLNQTELIAEIAKYLDITNAQSHAMLKSTLREIRSLLSTGKAVSIPNWGTFDTVIHESRRGFLPLGFLPSGKGYAILPKRRVPVFRTAKALREDVYDLEPNAEENAQ